MSGTLIDFGGTMPAYLHASAEDRRSQQATTGIAVLLVVGLASGWIASVFPIEQSVTTVGRDGKFAMELVKGPVYYGAHGLSICCMTVAALLSALDGRWRLLDLGTRLAFYILLLEVFLWTGFGYTTDELLSSKIFGATGPFVWISLLTVVVGLQPRVWDYLCPTIRILAYASSALAIRTLVTLHFTTYHGSSKYTEYTKLLLWLGGWTLLSSTRITGWQLILRLFPVIGLIPLVLCSQSRSLTLDTSLLVIIFVMLRAREKGSMVHAVTILLALCVFGILAASVVYSLIPETVDASITALDTRLTEDTRSGQYTDFFAVVPLSDLILGRGPNGTWYWRGMGDYQFFDNGYLWMLFIGGVPTLCCYLRIVVWPAMRAVGTKPRGDDAAAVWLAIVWSLCLTGFSVFTLPGVEVTNFVTLLFVGRCHLLLANHSAWLRTATINRCYSSAFA